MVTENTTIWEMGFKLVRTFCQNIDYLLVIPAVKYAAFGFGAFVVFSKKYLIPKNVWKITMKIV
jgi:hypothetical protein